jgi:magnesium chelatase subunit I
MAGVSSLVQLIEQASAKAILDAPPSDDHGITESLPFPFMAIVGQTEMKTALLLTLINPAVSGVLLIGPRGTGKTSRALAGRSSAVGAAFAVRQRLRLHARRR